MNRPVHVCRQLKMSGDRPHVTSKGYPAAMPYDPTRPDADTHIRSLIRRGAIDFDGIVSELAASGFIDEKHDAIESMSRPSFNSFDSDEFDTLFAFFFPNKTKSMTVLAYGVPMHRRGDFVYALYDAKQITADALTKLVRAKYPPP